jgi:hypothetical protein
VDPAPGAHPEPSAAPAIVVGTVRLIREGKVRVRPGIERFTASGAVFGGGAEEAFVAGMLREISLEARRVAQAVARARSGRAPGGEP